MKIDVCIPVCKPDEKLLSLLNGLANQTVKPDNIIIMYTQLESNDHLADCYVEAANAVCELKVHELPASDFDHGKTRADGVRYSDADIIICMTQDAIPSDAVFV